MRTTPASSRHGVPADRKFTQWRYTAAAVISAPMTQLIFRQSQIRRGLEGKSAIFMARFSEELFGSANCFVSDNDPKANAPARYSRTKLIQAIWA
jgi:hypothetical protein